MRQAGVGLSTCYHFLSLFSLRQVWTLIRDGFQERIYLRVKPQMLFDAPSDYFVSRGHLALVGFEPMNNKDL